MLVPAAAQQAGDVVALLQAFPQQGAVGCVVGQVHCGKDGPDLVRQDGHLQAVDGLLQHPGLHLLYRADTHIHTRSAEVRRRPVETSDVQTGAVTFSTYRPDLAVTLGCSSCCCRFGFSIHRCLKGQHHLGLLRLTLKDFGLQHLATTDGNT